MSDLRRSAIYVYLVELLSWCNLRLSNKGKLLHIDFGLCGHKKFVFCSGIDIYRNYLPKHAKQNLYAFTSDVGHFQELINMFKDHASEIVLIPRRETDVTDVQKWKRNQINLLHVFNAFKTNVTLT